MRMNFGALLTIVSASLLVTSPAMAQVTRTAEVVNNGATFVLTLPNGQKVTLPLAVLIDPDTGLPYRASGGGGTGGGGDASAVNQTRQIAAEEEIRDRTGARTSPATGSTNWLLTDVRTALLGTLTVGTHAVTQSGSWTMTIGGTLPAFAATPTVNLGTLNGAATASGVAAVNTTLGTPFQAGGAISNTAFGISGNLPAFAATPTVNLGTLNGAATAAGVATVNTTLGTPFQAGGSIGNTGFNINSGGLGSSSTPIYTTSNAPIDGVPGSVAPAYTRQVGGVTPGGNLRTLATDSRGALQSQQVAYLDSNAVAMTASTATQIDNDVSGTAMTAAQRAARVYFTVQVITSPTAPVYLCFSQGAGCSASSYSSMIASGVGAGTQFNPPAGHNGTIYAFSAAAVTLKVSSQVAQ